MHLLPLSLGRLAEHTQKRSFGQFALECALLRVHPDNTFEAVATDTRMLVRVTGPCVVPPTPFPAIPEFDAAPDDRTMALIPADAWKRAFTWARKLTRQSRGNNAVVPCVAVRIGEEHTAFAAANEYHPWWEFVPNVVARFPPYESILAAASRVPGARLTLNPELLAGLLETAAAVCGDDPKGPQIEMETHVTTQPMVLRGGLPDGIRFTGLLMPIAPDVPPVPTPVEAGRISALVHDLAELRAERDDLARQVAELKAALAHARTPSLPDTQ